MNNVTTVGIMKPAFSLWWREVIRFVRDRSRLFGALGQPLLFWLLLGGGLGGMFRLPASMGEMSYLEYLFPGILALVVLFTAIFSTISIIEDRNSGFLQSVLVAPISRSSIVLGKITGGTFLALIQAVLLCVAIPFLGIPITGWAFLELFAELLLIAFALTGLGYLIAWPMDSTQGFHSIMNLLLIPMWLLSGAFFPAEGLPAWLSWIMVVNPLTYGMNLIRGTLYGDVAQMTLSWMVTIGFAIVTFIVAVILTHRREQGS
ncbi:MAG: putative multidrug ABC transporter permease YbhR [Candidatus Marinimicrobia bacterium]|nr:putative multidrug ABC transporter permease YbhR [Candidatus Neomarinimicrobiota bacterium]